MENAADALKIGFIIFVFVVATTIIFSLVSQAKSTAEYVLYYSDETNFYEPIYSGKNRKVTVSEVVSSLYRYYKETVGITVKLKDGTTYMFDLGNNESVIKDGEIINAKTQLTSEKAREENLANFINNKLLKLPNNTTFNEGFVEVPVSGIYERGEDDTEIVLSSGGKKVYITYSQD